MRRWKVSLLLVLTVLASLAPTLAATAARAPRPLVSATEQAPCAFTSRLEVRLVGDAAVRGMDSRGWLADQPATAECSGPQGAAASTSFGSKTFLPSSPSYSRTDSNSSFSAQTTFTAGYPTAFGFTVNPLLASFASGPVTRAYASRAPANCTYNKPGVSVYYPFHWSCPGQTTGRGYTFTGQWSFPILVSGTRGTATISWQFNYIIYLRITKGLGGALARL